jgi:hypothetical protein
MLRFFLFLALLLTASPAPAWWEYGHETVARIALAEVQPKTRAEIARLIRHSRALDTPTCPIRNIEEASVWADCVRAMKDRFSYTAPWHYQNVNVCKPFDQKAACRDGNCVSAQIERNARLLADRSLPTRERLQALAFLVHFVGDLHMPLHAGDRGDLGGNQLAVSYGLIAGRTNLHGTWDGYLAERAISTPSGEAAGLLGTLSAAEREQMRQGNVEDWARQSWEISRDHAYATALGGDPCAPLPETRPVIGEETTRALLPVVRAQIARGGLRLARLLDEALA